MYMCIHTVTNDWWCVLSVSGAWSSGSCSLGHWHVLKPAGEQSWEESGPTSSYQNLQHQSDWGQLVISTSTCQLSLNIVSHLLQLHKVQHISGPLCKCWRMSDCSWEFRGSTEGPSMNIINMVHQVTAGHVTHRLQISAGSFHCSG